jgi:hypothetical protein
MDPNFRNLCFKHMVTHMECMQARYHEVGYWLKDCTEGSMSTLGLVALVRDPLASRVNCKHRKHISGMMVELPGGMRQLSWIIDDNMPFRKCSFVLSSGARSPSS